MPVLEVKILPAFTDNYIFLLKNDQNDLVAIDPGDAHPVIEYLEINGGNLKEIWLTHHHEDHIGGIGELKIKYGCKILCSQKDLSKIKLADIGLREGQFLETFGVKTRILEVPGHTLGHIAYFIENSKILFCGDSIFSLGCGRIFEGNPEIMRKSLQKIEELPKDTIIYCAHEYTYKNCKFAQTVDPNNNDLIIFEKEINEKIKNSLYTVPTTLSLEKKLNPFLRASSKGIRQQLKMLNADDLEVFSRLRELRNNF